MARECGTCSACCKVLAIKELDKPVGIRCPHQKTGGGCGIYESRPPSCRSFACDWILGLGDENDQPNITKIVLDGHGYLMQMWEVQRGALDTNYAIATRQQYLNQGYLVSFLPFRGQKKLYLPPGLSKEEIQAIRESCEKENMKVILTERA